jgi:signal transduction histidine kinase
MNAVLGLSRLLTTTSLSLEQAQYVSMIANSGQLLLTIINDILDYSSEHTRWTASTSRIV